MAKNLKQIEVKLNDPLTIGVNGTQSECDTVLLTGPSSKQRKAASRLKRLIVSTMTSESRNSGEKPKVDDKPEESTKIDWDDIVNLLSASTSDDEELVDKAYKYLLKLIGEEGGGGSISGMPITDDIFDRFSFDDVERLLGEYVANFLMSSLTQKKAGKK
jgi:hypothetical protein